MPGPNELYQTDEEVLDVVRRFESCELPPADFNHREHLLVALCYLLRMNDAEALAHIRARIGRYAAAHGVNPSLYHETITVFWLKRVRSYVDRVGPGNAGDAAREFLRVGAAGGGEELFALAEGHVDDAEDLLLGRAARHQLLGEREAVEVAREQPQQHDGLGAVVQ